MVRVGIPQLSGPGMLISRRVVSHMSCLLGREFRTVLRLFPVVSGTRTAGFAKPASSRVSGSALR